jgi:hypothetical protein
MPEVEHFRRLTGQADRVAIGIGSLAANSGTGGIYGLKGMRAVNRVPNSMVDCTSRAPAWAFTICLQM